MVMSSIFRAENLEVSGKVFIFVDRNGNEEDADVYQDLVFNEAYKS